MQWRADPLNSLLGCFCSLSSFVSRTKKTPKIPEEDIVTREDPDDLLGSRLPTKAPASVV